MTQQQDSGSVVIIRSNEVAPDPRVETEAKTLNDAGWNVTILAWDRGASMADEDRDYAHITRFLLRAPYGARFRNVPRKLRWNLWLLCWLIANRRKYTHIHACDLDTAVPALMARMLFGKKMVYDVFDNVVIQASIGGVSGERAGLLIRVAGRIIKWVENCVVKRADAVILVDECRRELLGAKPKRLEFIYNSPEAVEFEPLQSEDGNLRIAYIGQLSRERGIMEMLDVVARRPEFSLDLAGFGADESAIAARAAELPNVTWHGRVDYDRAIELSRRADVLFATYDPAIPLHKYSSPHKLFEALALGKPIVVAEHTGMDVLVERHRIGYVVRYADLGEIERALHAIARMSDEQREELASRTRKLCDERYSAGIMRQRLLALYADLL